MLELHERPISALAFQPRGPKLVSGCPDGVFAVWQPAAGKKPLAAVEAGDGITQLVWAPSDTRVAIGGENGGVGVVVV
jgi:WD40 repeat protein